MAPINAHPDQTSGGAAGRRRAMKRVIKTLLARGALGFHVYKTLPRGVDLFSDLRWLLPKYRPTVMFDVGANIGQSAKKYRREFPSAIIYCFEPARNNFDSLLVNIRRDSLIKTYNFALGEKSGPVQLSVEGSPVTYRVIAAGDSVSVGRTAPTDMMTLDEFCRSESIKEISFLKIDTEGHDLHVLRGAKHLLENQQVDIVQAEVAMNPFNELHVPFEVIKNFLEDIGYFLFGIYEQRHEVRRSDPNLRRVDAVYISRRMMRDHDANQSRP